MDEKSFYNFMRVLPEDTEIKCTHNCTSARWRENKNPIVEVHTITLDIIIKKSNN
jgi:hypothetical protein